MKKILLVEDDPFLVDIYTKKLKDSGFSVEAVNDGEVALRELEERGSEFDLVVLDIIMPQVDGWEVLRKMKSQNSKNKDLKVIILSNLGQKEEVEKGMTLGSSKYLIKAHYTPSQIVEEIKKLLKD